MAFNAWLESESGFNAAETSFNESRNVWQARSEREEDSTTARTATIHYLEQTRTEAITYANAVKALFEEDFRNGTVANHRGLWALSVARVTLVHDTLLKYTHWLPNNGIPSSVRKVQAVLTNAQTWAQQVGAYYYAAPEAAQQVAQQQVAPQQPQGYVEGEVEDDQAYIKQEEEEQ